MIDTGENPRSPAAGVSLNTMRAVYERLPGHGYYVQVPGMFHLDMTDNQVLSSLVSWPGLTGRIGGDRAHRIINAYSVAFFDQELRGHPAPLLDGPSGQFPEVLLETADLDPAVGALAGPVGEHGSGHFGRPDSSAGAGPDRRSLPADYVASRLRRAWLPQRPPDLTEGNG